MGLITAVPLPLELCEYIWRYKDSAYIRNIGMSSRRARAWARAVLRRRGPQTCFFGTHAAGRGGGRMHALDLHTGAPRWALATSDTTCTPALSPELRLVYVCGETGTVRAMDTRTGRVEWRTELDQEVCFTRLLLHLDRLFVRTLVGQLWCLCPRSGRVLWRRATYAYPGIEVYYSAPVPSATGKVVYFIDEGCNLLGARVSTGNIAWRSALNTRLTQVCKTPVVGRGRMWASAIQAQTNEDLPRGVILCLDSNTGRCVWMRDTGWDAPHLRLCPPAGRRPPLLLGTCSFGVLALLPASGEKMWEMRTNACVNHGPPALTPHGLVLLTAWSTATMYAVRLRNGTVAWKTTRSQNTYITSSPTYVHAHGLVLYCTEEDGVYAHHVRDGSMAWHCPGVTSETQHLHGCGVAVC